MTSDTKMPDDKEMYDGAIAVVGMAVRLPDAATPEAFWENLRAGRESIRFFTEDQLRERGVPDELLRDPDYVKAGVVLDGFDMWDAGFFGFSPREAEIMDPQHRVFLECAWEALEHGGFDPARFNGAVGVFAGSGMTSYMMYNLVRNRELMDGSGLFLVRHTGNDKDFLATRVSYNFDLKGPSLNIQTACSTSLVAIHVAVQHLLSGECDMALAGGVTIELPHGTGYQYKDGEILSPDGHCRPFDADSRGTVFGSGAGAVLLRRLADAIADGDQIHAVIRGSAVNNDGASKVGYLAPSVDGQARAIAEALSIAGVDPATVGYIETHGTGTPVGDPIEVAALGQVYGAAAGTSRIALSSVKSNIGHTDTAAGVIGFIRAVLSLQHRTLTPTLHYRAPNPAIDFDATPFYVSTHTEEWRSSAPLRAAVSSLGVGGTNAHVVLEQAPPAPAGTPSREHQLLLVSARTDSALDTAAANLADHFTAQPATDLADAAHTLQVGRARFTSRLAVVARSTEEAAELLEELPAERVRRGSAPDRDTAPSFMFAGGGAQYPGMCRDLYDTEAVFRAAVDECLTLVQPQLDTDLRSLLFPAPEADHDELARTLERPALALPALFTMQYAQARLWQSWGIEPAAMIGHSMGEYTAACLAGVFTLRDALGVVALRGRLFETLPEGGMLSVPLSPAALEPLLPPGTSIAAINAPELCAVSGPPPALDALQQRLQDMEVECRRIHISVAAHSPMLEPILAPFADFLRTLRLGAPTVPIVSNLSGTWLRADEATSADYWVRHLRQTVRFSDGLALLLQDPTRLLLEVGPGRTLSSLARMHPQRGDTQPILYSTRHPEEQAHDRAFMLAVLGQLWIHGVEPDWAAFRGAEKRRRTRLPTYPFERRRYWIEAPSETVTAPANVANADPRRWFSEPVWRHAPLQEAEPVERVLVFADASGPGAETAAELAARGVGVTSVRPGRAFSTAGDTYEVRIGEREDYDALFTALRQAGGVPRRMLHLLNVGAAREAEATLRAFDSLLCLAQAVAEHELDDAVVVVATTGAVEVGGEGLPHPQRALVLGPVRVAPAEQPGTSWRAVDLADTLSAAAMASTLLRELGVRSGGDLAAWRGSRRLAQGTAPLDVSATTPALRKGGVYMITGGFGGIAQEVSRALAREYDARLVLLSRRAVPPRAEWPAQLEAGGPHAQLIRSVLELEELGAEVLPVTADVTDAPAVAAAVHAARERFGAIHGVIHAAGTLDDGLLQFRTPGQSAHVLAPKVAGTLVLDAQFAAGELDFMVLFSSVSALAGLPGQVDYTAANAFLDAFAASRSARGAGPTQSIGWSAWRDVGMLAAPAAPAAPDTERPGVSHPLVDRVEPAPNGDEIFTAELSPGTHWLLDEHRLRGGDPLVPGTGYLELALAAFGAGGAPAGSATELRDVFFMSPFAVPVGESRRLRLELGRASGEFVVLGHAGGTEWTELVRGSVAAIDAGTAPRHELADMEARCALHSDVPPDGGTEHLEFGPRWSNVRRLRYGHGEALAELALQEAFTGDLDTFALHPALLDMATGCAQGLFDQARGESGLHVPVSYGRICVRRPLPGRFFSHIRRRPEASAGFVVFDITLIDEAGEEIADIAEFTMRRVPAGALAEGGHALRVRRVDTQPAALVDEAAAIAPVDGVEAFRIALGHTALPHLLVSPVHIEHQLEAWRSLRTSGPPAAGKPAAQQAEDPALREELDRIREALEQQDAVAEALAVARKGRGGERRILGYVVLQRGAAATVSELRRHAKKTLPPHLVPSNFIELDTFPRLGGGDIDVAALPDPFGQVDDHTPPRTPMEQRIAAIWREVLGVERIGVHDNFFDVGGHSLLAVRVITRISRDIGVRLDQAIMVLQTLEQIAARCEREAGTGMPLAGASR